MKSPLQREVEQTVDTDFVLMMGFDFLIRRGEVLAICLVCGKTYANHLNDHIQSYMAIHHKTHLMGQKRRDV